MSRMRESFCETCAIDETWHFIGSIPVQSPKRHESTMQYRDPLIRCTWICHCFSTEKNWIVMSIFCAYTRCVCVCWDYHRTVLYFCNPNPKNVTNCLELTFLSNFQCFGVCPSSKNPSSIHVHHFSSLYTAKIERIDTKYLWFLKFGVIFGHLIIELRAGAVKAWRLNPFASSAPATAYGDSARLRSRNSFYIYYIYRETWIFRDNICKWFQLMAIRLILIHDLN